MILIYNSQQPMRHPFLIFPFFWIGACLFNFPEKLMERFMDRLREFLEIEIGLSTGPIAFDHNFHI